MSVQTQIDRISGNVTAALAAIAEKGVSVPSGSKSDALAELIASIEAGGGGAYKEGTITFAEETESKDYEIRHDLGIIPKVFGIYYRYSGQIEGVLNNYFMFIETGYYKYRYAYGYNNVYAKVGSGTIQSVTNTKDATEEIVRLSSNIQGNFTTDNQYYWFVCG